MCEEHEQILHVGSREEEAGIGWQGSPGACACLDLDSEVVGLTESQGRPMLPKREDLGGKGVQVPLDDGLRPHDEEGGSPVGPPRRQHDPEQAIGIGELWTCVG